MAEETINEVMTRLKARALHSQHYGLPSDKDDALALIAELETVRAERDALRAEVMSYKAGYDRIEAEIKDLQAVAESVLQPAALNTQPQAEWTPRRMRIKNGYNTWFYRESKQTALTFQDGDIVIAGETDHNGTHVRNLEDNAGALIPTEYLAPAGESEA